MEDITKGPKPTTQNANEKPTSPVEFLPLTKEDLEEINKLSLKIFKKYPESFPGLESYSGTDVALGDGDIFFNTKITLFQFLFALALTRHPLVKQIAKPNFEVSKFDPKVLVEEKVMKGIKILDLGCGPLPVFARCCRAMGADVWTVDKRPSNSFDFEKSLFTKKQRKIEIQRHIQLDLTDHNAVEIIRQKSLSGFDLVTESELVSESFYGGREISMQLLKKGGVHYNFLDRISCKLKE